MQGKCGFRWDAIRNKMGKSTGYGFKGSNPWFENFFITTNGN